MSGAEKAAAPVFVVGVGRSGSTIFFDMLARHPNVSWPSELSRRYPKSLWLNRLLMHVRSQPLADRLLPPVCGPSEAYPFWDALCPGFSNPYRDLSVTDLTTRSAERLRSAVAMVSNRRRFKFVAKLTGWPRARLLSAAFPEAKFIEVKRNPFSTATSLVEVGFWDGWRGPPNWRRGPLPAAMQEIWDHEGQSFVALAAIECALIEQAMAICRREIGSEHFLNVKYSDLCDNPIAAFREVIRFIGLEWDSRFEAALRRFSIHDRDKDWKSALSAEQQLILERTIMKIRELGLMLG